MACKYELISDMSHSSPIIQIKSLVLPNSYVECISYGMAAQSFCSSGLLYVAKEVNDILGDISLFYIIILQIYLQTQSKVTLTLDYKLYNIR